MSKLYEWGKRAWIKRDMRLDNKLGVDFSMWESNDETGVSEERGNQYQPSTDALARVLAKLPVTERDCILDIGCGKGKAMYWMSQFPFARVDGLELSAHLCEIARQNFTTLGMRDSQVIHEDATKFNGYDDYNYFYVFNAFPQQVFEQVTDRILQSMERKPRPVYFIYLNPVCKDVIERSGKFELMLRRGSVVKWFEYLCYVSRG